MRKKHTKSVKIIKKFKLKRLSETCHYYCKKKSKDVFNFYDIREKIEAFFPLL